MNWTIVYVILGVYAVMSVLSFVMMARDKRIARKNARRLKETRRVPERTLHLLEGLGGWAGSLVAQRTLRHKTQQRVYQLIYWSIVVFHIIFLGVYIWVDLSNRWF